MESMNSKLALIFFSLSLPNKFSCCSEKPCDSMLLYVIKAKTNGVPSFAVVGIFFSSCLPLFSSFTPGHFVFGQINEKLDVFSGARCTCYWLIQKQRPSGSPRPLRIHSHTGICWCTCSIGGCQHGMCTILLINTKPSRKNIVIYCEYGAAMYCFHFAFPLIFFPQPLCSCILCVPGLCLIAMLTYFSFFFLAILANVCSKVFAGKEKGVK